MYGSLETGKSRELHAVGSTLEQVYTKLDP